MHESVPLPEAYRLLNHGPTVLVSSAHAGQRNVMAAAWAMPLDFDPPKVCVVIDKNTHTRGLIEASGEFVLNVPARAQADMTFTVGNTSGRDALSDKFERYGISAWRGGVVAAPLIDGCVAWLECRVLAEPHNQATYDLFIGQVVAAHADPRVYSGGRWHFSAEHADLRTLHHLGAGQFLSADDPVQAHMLTP